ncbi:hypothetical protein JOM56_009523 [Amanita muscaria]
MVTTVSPSVQAHYESDKRKKHTLEKSKVTHLTRQLQLRLQYAKLKVDHGWQRQNLNEVENLYFHHSHMRVPKFQLQPTQPPALVVNAVAAESNTEPRGAQTNVTQTDSNGAGPAPLSPNHHPIDVTADLPPTQQHHESVALMPPSAPTSTDGACNPPSSPSNQHQSESLTNFLQALSNSCKKPIPTQATKSPLRTSPSVSSFTSNTPKTPTSSHLFPSSTSNSALTYDSFWSNHNSSRPFRSSFLSLLSSTDPEVKKVTAQSVLALADKDIITNYINNSSDFMTSASRPPPDATSTMTPMVRRSLPTIAEASEGG